MDEFERGRQSMGPDLDVLHARIAKLEAALRDARFVLELVTCQSSHLLEQVRGLVEQINRALADEEGK